MKTIAAVLVLAFPAAAAAQELGVEWIERVSRETSPSRGPLPVKPVTQSYSLGLLSYYDDNINLEPDNEDANTVLNVFGSIRMEYSDPQVDGALDALGNYKYYIPDHEASDDEERVYGRIRYIDPRWSFEIAEIFRHESDPVGVQFADRVDRIVSSTVPRATVELAGGFALEAVANVGFVRFLEESFNKGDNLNLRADLSAILRASDTFDLVAQAGYLAIDYRYETGGAPDVDGVYVRGGVRGELLPTVSIGALAGWTSAESDDFESGAEGKDDETADVAVNLRWEATPEIVVYGDYTRQISFAGGGDPYQIVNRFSTSVEAEITPFFTLRGRAQFDHADSALGVEREYMVLSTAAAYKSSDKVWFEGGLIWRNGDVDVPGDFDYDNFILYAGVIATN